MQTAREVVDQPLRLFGRLDARSRQFVGDGPVIGAADQEAGCVDRVR